MRVNRGKMVRKHLRFYRIVYGLSDPFECILDANFIFNAIKYKVDILDRLKKVLQGAEVHIYIMRSSLKELQQVGNQSAATSIEFAEKFCKILEDAQHHGDSPAEKTTSFLRHQYEEWLKAPNSRLRRYICASQDKDLRSALAKIPGIPLFYFNNVTLVMEPPSETSKEFNKEIESSKVALNATEAIIVENIKDKNKKRKRGSLTDDGIITGQGSSNSSFASATNSSTTFTTNDGADDAPLEKKNRVKHKARASNPLASLAPKKDSSKQKQKHAAKYKRT